MLLDAMEKCPKWINIHVPIHNVANFLLATMYNLFARRANLYTFFIFNVLDDILSLLINAAPLIKIIDMTKNIERVALAEKRFSLVKNTWTKHVAPD